MKLLDLLISKFKKNTTYIGVFVSPSSYVEVVKFDIDSNSIVKQDKSELIYDSITRKINDVNQLEVCIARLFDDLDIPLNSPTVLSLPTTFLGHTSLPLELDDSEIKSVLTDQLESNFLFRTHEPVISYECITKVQESNSVHLAFTAIQKEQLVEIEAALKNQGINIVAVDTSYASLLRGLSIAGICNDDINEAASWTVLLINNNNLVLLSLIGNRLIDFSEIPIAVRSFQANEICSVIVSYSIEGINNQNPDHLIIISKSDEVTAAEVAGKFDINCKITAIEENMHNTESLFNSSNEERTLINLETIGAAFWNKSSIPVNFNFLGKKKESSGNTGKQIKIGNISFYLTSKLVQNIFIGLIVFSLLIVVGTYLACSAIDSNMEKKYADLTHQKSQLDNALSSVVPENKVSTDDIINKVFDKNGKILHSFNALGSVIPEKVWIESFEMKDDFNASIKGKAYSVDDVVAYYQNLIKSAYFQNFKISSIKVIGENSASSSSSSSGVSIIPKNEGQSPNSQSESIPSIPSLPNLNSQKYYEFTFGNSTSSTVSTDTASASPSPDAPASGVPSPSPVEAGK